MSNQDEAGNTPNLSADAPSFTPRASAASFVPSWLQQPSEPAAPAAAPAPAPGTEETSKSSTSAPKAEERSKSSTPKPTPTPPVAVEEEEEIDEELSEDLFGKETMNVIFMGHVDAGKSTMGGNILFLTGMVDKRTMEKYEKEAREANRESWYLSWALDTSAEERKKGKTVECGRAYFETPRRRYTILDAPGHKNFVPSMIGGAQQADIGVLVISARKGEFETGFERGGQTREHAVLAKTSGVSRLVVVINKMDDPTVQWSKERYDECISKITPFLKGTGYNPKTDLTFLPISGFTGANLKDPMSAKVCPWYKGPSLLQFLDGIDLAERKTRGPLLIPIMEKYKEMGTVAMGKVESGQVRRGQTVLILPTRKTAEVTALYLEEEKVEAAKAGDNIRMNLKGVEEEEISPGHVICTRKRPANAVMAFEAQLVILEHKNILCAGYNAVLHVHSIIEEVSIAALLHLIDKKTNRRSKRPPQFVKKGQKVIVRLETTAPVCVEAFEDHPQLGRFTLRDEGKTIAIGKITKLLPGSQ
ncbi:P-loop containing nucleoside triphosphate hydrolase protein [Piptocephalis cylindrospora]|uniref:Eukaryotic peptide chain release factor GTP-binding subunit n=1 Tax=Piptocephalis cylindrospora TaxID=1907219 RepID=A0A4P9Y7K0_9FUNG|nr:P-loop containing nucleoside triphosphate hydrolase protein [Piptocephalis cylindrospora]|eukprot:RKP15023.1 P-loop containing nucleoside triphosphate hydrolase protein [Piptocephalis cylindrospora]